MNGNLWLDGGQGADIMTGGSGVNDYLYSATSDSTSKSMDVITNFHSATDVLDFTGLGQKFGPVVALSASATSLAAGSIGWQTVGGNTFIYVNTGGNSQALSSANMQIELQGSVPLTSNNILHL
jgi:Ca2+-binding RTX toxin-like protein